MSCKIIALTVGKGITEEEGARRILIQRYYEVTVQISDETDIELVKASAEGLIDGWHTGRIEKGNREWTPERIKWTPAEGPRGPYERYPAEGEKAESTQDYQNLLADLKAHDGKLTRDGYFYWLWNDALTVSRKKVDQLSR